MASNSALPRPHHHVELHLPPAPCRRRRRPAPALETHLVEHFEHHRVDLAGHDAGARLYRRQLDFAETGARAGREQAQVVGDAGQFQRQIADFA